MDVDRGTTAEKRTFTTRTEEDQNQQDMNAQQQDTAWRRRLELPLTRQRTTNQEPMATETPTKEGTQPSTVRVPAESQSTPEQPIESENPFAAISADIQQGLDDLAEWQRHNPPRPSRSAQDTQSEAPRRSERLRRQRERKEQEQRQQ